MTVPGPVRVVVVEDSAAERRSLVAALEAEGTISVVGEASSAAEAVRVIADTKPDVVTMDLELPGEQAGRAGGILATEGIVAVAAVPILVLSAHAGGREDTLAIEALAAGAVDCLPKAAPWGTDAGAGLRRRVLVLSRLQMVHRTGRGRPALNGTPAGRGVVVALAASTGGPSALRTVVEALRDIPAPILLVQHIHAEFADSFATWLQAASGVPSHLATHGEHPQPGHVHVAPPELHLRLGPRGTLQLDPRPERISRPSCDELLLSVAAEAGPLGVGAVLTGMGDDGARGLLALRERGGATFAQDGASAAVDGMPRAARELGAVQRSLPLDDLGPALAEAVRRVAAR